MDNFIRRLISPPEKKISRFVSSGSTAADLGCGPGYFTVPLAKLVGRNGKVYAIDSDAKSIQKLREKTGAELQSVVETSTASAAHVDMVPNRSVDFVLANGLLCCMSDHKGAVSEIKRILKPTGIAYLSVSKICRRSDPKAVQQEEWNSILQDFEVRERNEGILNRWAVVSPRA
jgi:ubiquinone/menaquinone biosynthesis C-methylase UbiE